MPKATETTDQPSTPRRRIRYLRIAGICVVVFVLGVALIQSLEPGLSASERRFLGVWTWQDKPGEMTCHYREDGTMSYTFAPNNTSPYIKKWKVDANVISFERVERNLVTSIVKKVLHKHEQYQVTSNADGSITFKSNNGKVKVLIPWSSDSEQEWSFRTIPQIQRPQSGDRW